MLVYIAFFLLFFASNAYNIALLKTAGVKSSTFSLLSTGKELTLPITYIKPLNARYNIPYTDRKTKLFATKPQFGSDRHYPGQDVYAPTKIYGFSWKLKNFILSSAMFVTFPIRLLFLLITRAFQAIFITKSKATPSNLGTVTRGALESSVAVKTPVVVAAVTKDNEEAGKALMERASIMVTKLSISPLDNLH